MGKFAKYIENKGLYTCQYCFANISATKAPIFMKFETKLHKIVNNNQHHFCKDPSTHAYTQSINVRSHVLTRARTFMPRVCVCVLGSLQKWCFLLFSILWSCVSNFIKIGALVAEIFAKQYWCVFNPSFSMLFCKFSRFCPSKTFKNG